MSGFATFMVGWLGFCAAFAALAFAPFWADRAIVFLMRGLRIYAFPEAIRLAVSLERDTGQWKVVGTYRLEHPTIGTIEHYRHASILSVDTGGVEWNPNWIERRIIYDAAQRALRRRINDHLAKTLP